MRPAPTRSAPRLARFAFAALSALLGAGTLPAGVAPATDQVAAQIQGRDLIGDKRFEDAAAVYAQVVKVNPAAGDAWSNLGYALHMTKRYDEAIPAFVRAADMGFNPPANLYNVACAHALKGDRDQALAFLERAFKARYADQETLENDTDLDSLRADPRFASLTGITKGLPTPPAGPAGRDEGWRWDLDFCARRMQQMHWSLFAKLPEPSFRAELDRLKSEVSGLSDEQVRLKLRRIVAMVGDGHTSVTLAPVGATTIQQVPLHMFRFEDGLYVMGASKDNAALVGARVLKVGPLDADRALDAVKPFCSVDNDMGYLAQGPAMLTRPVVLQAIGAAESASVVELTVAKGDETPRTVRVAAVDRPAQRQGGLFATDFVYVHDGAGDAAPLLLHNPAEPLRVEHDAAHKLVYFYFGAVQNTPRLSFADAVKKVFDTISATHAEYLVIDMRFNGGGNTDIVRPLIHGLIADRTVNLPGHLYVITGRHTFSAAQNTVNMLDINTNAIFVGEPTGSRPNFVGESTFFILPHSKTRVYCSSRYWQYSSSIDERTWVGPGIAAPMTFAAYSHNQDPCMDAILDHIAYRAEHGAVTEAVP